MTARDLGTRTSRPGRTGTGPAGPPPAGGPARSPRAAGPARPLPVRLLAVLALALWLVAAGGGAAYAQDLSGQGPTDFRSVITSPRSPVPGVTVRIVENGARLELRNTGPADVIVLGNLNEPFLRIGPSGVYENAQSPWTEITRNRWGSVTERQDLRPAGVPDWRRVSGDTVARWYDHRIHWALERRLPLSVSADPDREHRVMSWSVPLVAGETSYEVTGELRWVPGPSPWPGLAAVAGVLAVVAAGAGRLVWRRTAAPATAGDGPSAAPAAHAEAGERADGEGGWDIAATGPGAGAPAATGTVTAPGTVTATGRATPTGSAAVSPATPTGRATAMGGTATADAVTTVPDAGPASADGPSVPAADPVTPRVLGAATGAVILAAVAHLALVAAERRGGPGAVAGAFVSGNLLTLLACAVGAAGAALLWRGRAGGAWPAVPALVTLSLRAAGYDLPVLWRSSSPFLGPMWLDRALTVLVTGAGLGLAAALVLYVRRSTRLAAAVRAGSRNAVAPGRPPVLPGAGRTTATEAAAETAPKTTRKPPKEAAVEAASGRTAAPGTRAEAAADPHAEAAAEVAHAAGTAERTTDGTPPVETTPPPVRAAAPAARPGGDGDEDPADGPAEHRGRAEYRARYRAGRPAGDPEDGPGPRPGTHEEDDPAMAEADKKNRTPAAPPAPRRATDGAGGAAESTATENTAAESTATGGGAGAGVSRRRFVAVAGGAGAAGLAAGAAAGGLLAGGDGGDAGAALTSLGSSAVPFHGARQAGITTPSQARLVLGAYDLEPGADRARVAALMRRWSDAAARMAAGEPADLDDRVAADAGPASLTVTFGFGASLFDKLGLADRRPAALAPLPAFAGDALDPARGDGDLLVQVCADDALVAFHAARSLQRLARGTARPRWRMNGFTRSPGATARPMTHRNLMGQIDGTNNPRPADEGFEAKVFVGEDAGQPWLAGGSFVVIRRIRMLLDDWDGLDQARQEKVIGRRKDDGAPLTGGGETTPADFGARGPDGAAVIAADAHIRVSAPEFNRGAAMLRRGYSYDDGFSPDGTPDAGLIFIAWQADPREAFVPVQTKLARGDALSRFIRHESSALFAAPPGARPGGYVGQSLLEA